MVAQACNLNTQEAEGGGLVGSWSQAWTTGESSLKTLYTPRVTLVTPGQCAGSYRVKQKRELKGTHFPPGAFQEGGAWMIAHGLKTHWLV